MIKYAEIDVDDDIFNADDKALLSSRMIYHGSHALMQCVSVSNALLTSIQLILR